MINLLLANLVPSNEQSREHKTRGIDDINGLPRLSRRSSDDSSQDKTTLGRRLTTKLLRTSVLAHVCKWRHSTVRTMRVIPCPHGVLLDLRNMATFCRRGSLTPHCIQGLSKRKINCPSQYEMRMRCKPDLSIVFDCSEPHHATPILLGEAIKINMGDEVPFPLPRCRGQQGWSDDNYNLIEPLASTSSVTDTAHRPDTLR